MLRLIVQIFTFFLQIFLIKNPINDWKFFSLEFKELKWILLRLKGCISYFYFLKKFKIILELSSLDPFQLFSYGLGYFMIHVVHVVRKTMQTRPILHIQYFGLAVQLVFCLGWPGWCCAVLNPVDICLQLIPTPKLPVAQMSLKNSIGCGLYSTTSI